MKFRPSVNVEVIPETPTDMILFGEKREAVAVSGSGGLPQLVAGPRDEVPKQAVTFPVGLVLAALDMPVLTNHRTAGTGLF